jgi:hypothetical protein
LDLGELLPFERGKGEIQKSRKDAGATREKIQGRIKGAGRGPAVRKEKGEIQKSRRDAGGTKGDGEE